MSNDLWIFGGLMVLGQFSPGPDMLLLTRTALREGMGSGLRMSAGIACGLMVHAGIAVAGVAVAFQRVPMMKLGLQWLAACYLFWLASGLLRSAWKKPSASVGEDEPFLKSGRSAWLRGLLCNLLNPKVAIFLASVCAPFLTEDPTRGRALILWVMIVGLGFSLWSLWVLLLQQRKVRQFYESAGPWIDGMFGVALGLLALRLMIS